MYFSNYDDIVQKKQKTDDNSLPSFILLFIFYIWNKLSYSRWLHLFLIIKYKEALVLSRKKNVEESEGFTTLGFKNLSPIYWMIMLQCQSSLSR